MYVIHTFNRRYFNSWQSFFIMCTFLFNFYIDFSPPTGNISVMCIYDIQFINKGYKTHRVTVIYSSLDIVLSNLGSKIFSGELEPR